MAKSKHSAVTNHDPTLLGREFKRCMRDQAPLLGGIVVEYLRPSLCKIYRNAGFDFIFLENEHTLFDGSALCDFVLSARDNGLPIIAKIPACERSSVARLLEAGVVGIQLPRTESREQVETLVNYMTFPPTGSRAGAPCFGNVDYAAPTDHRKWLRRADESVAVVAHIETAEGYRNAEQIVSTPRLDMVYVGPYDFSIAMGHPGDYDHSEVRGPMLEILGLCRKHNVMFGTTASSADAAKIWVEKGCCFFEVVDELSLIGLGATDIVQSYR